MWFAFAGAASAAVIVYAMGSVGRSGATPVKLALAGAVVSVFLASITTSVLIFDNKAADTIRLWSIGSLKGESFQMLRPLHLTVWLASWRRCCLPER